MERIMKNFTLFVLLVALALVASTVLYAGNPSKRGTAGAVQLTLPVGARGASLGGAALSTLNGVESIHWNPAGLAGGMGGASVETMFSQMTYIADIDVSYFAVGLTAGDIGTFGFTIKSIGFGDIPETTEDFPDGTGNTYSPVFITVGATYSKQLTDRISIGITGKLISETIVRTNATGFAMDAGVIYKVGGQSPLAGFSFGVALKNIGPNMRYDGADLERNVVPPNSDPKAQIRSLRFFAQEFELPSTFEMGASYDVPLAEMAKLSFSGAFLNNNFGEDMIRGGAELSFMNMLTLRAGYGTPNENSDAFVFNGMTFGGGVNFDLGGGARFAVDYSYASAQVFDATHTIAIKLGF